VASTATLEYFHCPPRVPTPAGSQVAIASGDTHRVTSRLRPDSFRWRARRASWWTSSSKPCSDVSPRPTCPSTAACPCSVHGPAHPSSPSKMSTGDTCQAGAYGGDSSSPTRKGIPNLLNSRTAQEITD